MVNNEKVVAYVEIMGWFFLIYILPSTLGKYHKVTKAIYFLFASNFKACLSNIRELNMHEVRNLPSSLDTILQNAINHFPHDIKFLKIFRGVLADIITNP